MHVPSLLVALIFLPGKAAVLLAEFGHWRSECSLVSNSL